MDHVEFKGQAKDGLQLYYQAWQPESGLKAVVCLVHGIGDHSGRYAHVGAALAGAGYALLAFDLRGHGKSAGPRGHTPSFEALMDDVDQLLGAAEWSYPGFPRFLYGHSMGGNIVLNYALRRRPALAGVIATGPWLRLAFDPPALQVRMARWMDRIRPAFTQGNGLDLQALCHDPQVVRTYQRDPLVHDRITAHMFLSMMDAGAWALEHAAEFPVPLLLMHGGADRLTSALASEEFAQRAGGQCTLKLWDGLYHETHNEPQKVEVLAAMVDWLDAHCPPVQAADLAKQAIS